MRCAKLVESPPALSALAEAQAGAGAEDVVVAELDEAAAPVRGAVADAEVEVPGLPLAERDLHVGERVRRRTERIDRHRVEGGDVAEPALPEEELVRDQHVARLEGQGPPHHALAREQEAAHEDAPDARLLALVDVVADVHGRVAPARLDAHDGAVVAAVA